MVEVPIGKLMEALIVYCSTSIEMKLGITSIAHVLRMFGKSFSDQYMTFIHLEIDYRLVVLHS